MAKCEKREIKPEPPPVEYCLTMSEVEAKMLSAFIEVHGKLSFFGRELADMRRAIEGSLL